MSHAVHFCDFKRSHGNIVNLYSELYVYPYHSYVYITFLNSGYGRTSQYRVTQNIYPKQHLPKTTSLDSVKYINSYGLKHSEMIPLKCSWLPTTGGHGCYRLNQLNHLNMEKPFGY